MTGIVAHTYPEWWLKLTGQAAHLSTDYSFFLVDFSSQKNHTEVHMLFQVLSGFKPIFYTTHPNEEPNYSDTYKDTNFQLYQKYTYEDVCRLLNWKKNMNAQNIGGYFYDSDTKTLPVFINYDKAENAIAYEDRFVTQAHLIALSKHPRKIDSSDADHFFKRTDEDKDNKILLFIRKNKDDKEAKEFYFLGEIYAQGEPIPIKMEKTGDDAFEINYKLDVPVREDIYEYIVSEA